ncbi:MAG: hypothetical protein DMG27_19370 [Acidobacteria bacterium]|nr:MAG: hypothetical protein DMG27_19370 [Acidobacteriota bacterium]
MWTFKTGTRGRGSGVGARALGHRLLPSARRLPVSLAPDTRPLIPVLPALCLLLSLAPGPWSPTPAFAAAGLYQVLEIKPDVFVWLPDDVLDQEGDPDFARAGTAGFIIRPDGVVVVDTTNSPFHARELLYEIRRRTDQPVKYVIDTDPEGDHALGNEVFVDQQASIVATPGTQAGLRRYQLDLPRRLEGDWRLQARMRGFHPTLPNQTFEGETVLRFDRHEQNHHAGNAAGAQEIKLVSLETGLATAQAAVRLPAAKVAFLGGLFENGYFPHLGSRQQPKDIRRWIETLREVETWDVDVYVPGHGPPAGKKELSEFRKFLEWLTKEVEARVKQGKSPEQVEQELAPSLENFRWHAPELRKDAVGAVYSQLAGARPATAASPPSQH